MKSDSPTAARIALGMVAAMALSIPLGIALLDAHRMDFLESTRRTTQGRVTGKNCQNHGKIGYAYAVEEKLHKGSGTIPNQPCEDVEVGDHVNIVYSSQKPQMSRIDSPQSLRGGLFGRLFVLGTLGLGAACVIFRITSVEE